jgi:aspartate-semialdehyde dehydrogenase
MKIGIIGATGSVGREMINCIDALNIKYTELKLFAGNQSIGKHIMYNNKKLIIQESCKEMFKELDIALFAISTTLSKEYSIYAKEFNCLVIDNSSAFRLYKNVPLIIPEINATKALEHSGIIANPNCSTILMNVVIWDLYKKFGIERIVVSTYQSASGAGQKGINELKRQASEYSSGKNIWTDGIFGRQYLWNIFSHNSPIDMETGYNEEELKMIYETKKILNDDKIKISVTCVRVPVFRSHCESINITFKTKVDEDLLRDVLKNTKGIKILDDRVNNNFPEPLITSNKHDVYVGRIRKDLGQEEGYGYEIFISGDQILKGAALNAIQILKLFTN